MMQRKTLSMAAVALAASVATSQHVLAGSMFPSPYGPDDEIGAANNLSPEGVIKAAGLVTEGKTYPLGIVVSRDTPAFPPRFISVTVLTPGQVAGSSFGSNNGNYNDDIFTGWLGVASQIDGLGHLGAENTFYNNNAAADFVSTTGLTRLGIEKIPPIVTRGVMLDIAGARGVDMMSAGEVITVDDIESAADTAGVSIGRGDVVILHTGWLSLLGKDNQRFVSKEPGIGVEAAAWLAGQGVVAVGADTWGVEAVPHADPNTFFPAHVELLAKNGVYILENMETRELLADGVHEFLFVLGQARLKGAVQMIINPVAIR